MSVSGEPIKIGVVGDGPIGNLVVAKLLIEHGRNNNGKNNIKITHFTSNRVEQSGYSRRHILFITDELVAELEKNVLDCDNCLINIKNNQILTEDNEVGQKFLFTIRVLENIIERELNTNKKYCTDDTRCIFERKPNINEDSKPPNYFNEKLNYIFFATGTNSGALRHTYFYDRETPSNTTVKIISAETEPIIAFYTHLGTEYTKGIPIETIINEDKNSQIQFITKEDLNKNGINLNNLVEQVNIINNFYLFIQNFLNDKDIMTKYADNEHFNRMKAWLMGSDYKKDNLALNGYDNFTEFLEKFHSAINMILALFKPNYFERGEDSPEVITTKNLLFEDYINFLTPKNSRSGATAAAAAVVYNEMISTSGKYTNTILTSYSMKIYTLLEEKYNECPMQNGKCVKQPFLVNTVAQSLNSYGIINNNKLAYAAKKETTNFFMIGDMANAYSPGISVEIGFRFVNYIIPMFYNFYINNDRTIANCSQLNIVNILDDLLSDKYNDLLDKYINNGTDDTEIKLRNLIENIKTNSNTLCNNDDIFLAYYNIVSLIQYIKNSDLIIKGKKLIGISNALSPYNYKIMNDNKPKNQLEQFGGRKSSKRGSKRSSKLKF
jgi:hypothetical protein